MPLLSGSRKLPASKLLAGNPPGLSHNVRWGLCFVGPVCYDLSMTNHRIVWDTYTHRKSRTKDEIVRERVAFLVREANRLASGLDDQTPCGLRCSRCDTILVTESDLAKHFIVTDEAYLNLGECPND